MTQVVAGVSLLNQENRMLTKQQVFDHLVPENWEPDNEEKTLFFSDRLTITADSLDELDGVDVPNLIDELLCYPKMTAKLARWQVVLTSPVANDINSQDHYPSWVTAAVEQCDREESNGKHTGSWCLG